MSESSGLVYRSTPSTVATPGALPPGTRSPTIATGIRSELVEHHRVDHAQCRVHRASCDQAGQFGNRVTGDQVDRMGPRHLDRRQQPGTAKLLIGPDQRLEPHGGIRDRTGQPDRGLSRVAGSFGAYRPVPVAVSVPAAHTRSSQGRRGHPPPRPVRSRGGNGPIGAGGRHWLRSRSLLAAVRFGRRRHQDPASAPRRGPPRWSAPGVSS